MIRALIFCLCCLSTAVMTASGAESPSQKSPTSQVCMEQKLGSLPLYFIENQGQVDSDEAAFYIKGDDKTLYFTSSGLTIAMVQKKGGENQRWTMTLEFEGASPVEPRGENRQRAVFSYFKGDQAEWNTGLPTYSRIVYDNLWPGIDLVFSGTTSELKYEFVVAPGADPDAVRLVYRGATDVFVQETGELVASCPAGVLEDGVPVAYQEIDGRKRDVSMRYSLDAHDRQGAVTVGFDLGDYDAKEELILDPAFIVYCGYIGGSESEYGESIAVDGQGNAYVVGRTGSTEASFPVTVGPDLSYNGYTYDVFVAKVNSQGTGLDYCGYIGGGSYEYSCDIAVDDQGSAYVTGFTESGPSSFPVLAGPDLTYNGGGDAFVAKVNAQGTGLEYCGYIGGNDYDVGRGIAVDGQGQAYVTGNTESDELTFPVKVGPDLFFNGGSWQGDAFVARLNAQGTGLEYCGYIGGDDSDVGYDIALDGQGQAYVTGSTESDELTFPKKVGPDLTYNGDGDAFVARVDAQGTGLEYCGYIGGDETDGGYGIAVDMQGQAYVTGNTSSDELTFPVKVGPDLTYNGALFFGGDAYVAKVNAQGSGLEYCGYIGGSSHDTSQSIAVDTQGSAFVAGYTESGATTFPVTGGPDLFFRGDSDAFVARVKNQGTGLDYCGYIGGRYYDKGHGIALDTQGNAYVVGRTNSSESQGFPIIAGPELTYDGSYDTFVAKIEYTPGLFLQIDPDPLDAGRNGTFAVTNGQPNADTWIAFSLTGPGSTWIPPLNVTIDLAPPILHLGPMQTDSEGKVFWLVTVPIFASGSSIWLQGVQYGQTSNVVATSVQ